VLGEGRAAPPAGLVRVPAMERARRRLDREATLPQECLREKSRVRRVTLAN
jgi:hypothetical protein